jgi:hypothetical protein
MLSTGPTWVPTCMYVIIVRTGCQALRMTAMITNT